MDETAEKGWMNKGRESKLQKVQGGKEGKIGKGSVRSF